MGGARPSLASEASPGRRHPALPLTAYFLPSPHPWGWVCSTGPGGGGGECKAHRGRACARTQRVSAPPTCTVFHQPLQHLPRVRSCTDVLLTTNRNPLPPSSGGQKSKIKASAGPCSFRRLAGTSVPCSAGSRRSLACGPITPIRPPWSRGLLSLPPADRYLQSPAPTTPAEPRCMPLSAALRPCAPIHQAPGMCQTWFQAPRTGSDQKRHLHPSGAEGQSGQMDKSQVSST